MICMNLLKRKYETVLRKTDKVYIMSEGLPSELAEQARHNIAELKRKLQEITEGDEITLTA